MGKIMNISGLGGGVNLAALAASKTSPTKEDKSFSSIMADASGIASKSVSPAASATKLESASVDKPKESAADKFLDYQKKTTEEKMVERWLESHGVTKEEFDAMSPEEQQSLLAQMKQEMQDRMAAQASTPPLPDDYEPVDILV